MNTSLAPPAPSDDPATQDTHRLSAGPDDAGQRLDRFVAGRLPEFSRSRIKALIEQGFVALEAASEPAPAVSTSARQTISEPSRRVKPGQVFVIGVPHAAEARPQPQIMPLAVLYEDADLLVIDKAPGMVVHPAPGNPDHTLVNALLAHCGDSLSGIGGVKRPGIVHRLDKDTSGVMVVAKNDAAHRALSAAFARHDMERAYKAVVWGAPMPRRGRIEGNIGRSPQNRKKMAVVARGGKPSATEYRVLKTWGPPHAPIASLVECRLLTGRTHQVRVHLASLGHPLVGDPLYGRRRKTIKGWEGTFALLTAFGRQALHAFRLSFIHPSKQQKMSFETDFPSDLKVLLSELDRNGALPQKRPN